MDTEPPRLAMGWSAFAGSILWAMYTLTIAMAAKQKLSPRAWVNAGLNVVAGIVAGVLVAVFLGPALTALIPVASLRDPHVVGFGLGAGAWEVVPWVYVLIRGRAARIAREDGQ